MGSRRPFSFKQFTVHQHPEVMPVCTDACLFGAWVGQFAHQQVLDIGSGTGLLSLMLAQAAPQARITALEPQQTALDLSMSNLGQSPFVERIRLVQEPLETFRTPERFGSLVCNPPFFQYAAAEGSRPGRAQYMSGKASLEVQALAQHSRRLMAECGQLFVMYPPHEFGLFREAAASEGLHLEQQLQVFQKASDRLPFRCFGVWALEAESPSLEDFVIYQQDGSYTAAFVALLQPFYLYL